MEIKCWEIRKTRTNGWMVHLMWRHNSVSGWFLKILGLLILRVEVNPLAGTPCLTPVFWASTFFISVLNKDHRLITAYKFVKNRRVTTLMLVSRKSLGLRLERAGDAEGNDSSLEGKQAPPGCATSSGEVPPHRLGRLPTDLKWKRVSLSKGKNK